MIEPTLALQTAIRSHLINAPGVLAHVAADQVRAGSTRPDDFPSIIMAGAQTEYLGRAAGGQFVARVFLDVHVWAIEAGADTAKTITFAVQNALLTWPAMTDCALDEFAMTHVTFPRDPDPQFGHGVMKVEAVIRWSL
jgi:hypothetical protein